MADKKATHEAYSITYKSGDNKYTTLEVDMAGNVNSDVKVKLINIDQIPHLIAFDDGEVLAIYSPISVKYRPIKEEKIIK